MRRTLYTLVALLLALTGLLAAVGIHATATRASLAADGSCHVLTVRDGVTLNDQIADPAVCAAYDPTATATAVPPTNTPVPATATSIPPGDPVGVCGEDIAHWNPPTIGTCARGYENGDAPPQFVRDWIAANAAIYGDTQLRYGGDEASSPAELGMKWQAFKGVAMTSPAGTQVYLRYHAASNPMDRSAQYHSYEVWYRDTAGGVSFMQGWYDAGDPRPYPAGDRIPRRLGDPGNRPVILVVDQATLSSGQGTCEQWYMGGLGAFRPGFAVTICGVTYLYNADEAATAHDQATWQRNPQGGFGLHRRAESFYLPQQSGGRTGISYATPLGVACTPGTAGCLYNYVAPTLARDLRVEFGVARISTLIEKDFPCPGCKPVN